MIAQVAASGNVTLSPRSTSDLSLVGRLTPQNSSEGLAVVSQIFNNFLIGKPSDVIVQGAGVGPGSVSYLSYNECLFTHLSFKGHVAQRRNQVAESGNTIA